MLIHSLLQVLITVRGRTKAGDQGPQTENAKLKEMVLEGIIDSLNH